MMKPKLSDTVEDYLKIVYKLTADQDRAGTGEIAEELGVNPASVTDMLQRLAGEDPPLVDYLKHHGAALTPEGMQAALEIIRHHRLLELFLHDVLGYSWDQVHLEADRLEHVISELFEEKVAEYLGNPDRGLHGEPIPSAALEMPSEERLFLHDLQPGQTGLIRSVEDEDSGFLRYLEDQGLVPGTSFEVLEISPYDQTLHLKLKGKNENNILGPGVTSRILVEV